MALDTRVRKKTIKDKEFQIYLLKAFEGTAMAHKLTEIVLSVIPSLKGATNQDTDEVDVDFKEIAKVVFDKLSEKDLVEIIAKLLKELAVNGRQVNIDEYFAGNYGEMLAVVGFALQENFGSFFDGLAMLGE